jgi:hypothetical protein
MANSTLTHSDVLINIPTSSEDILIELIEKAQALVHVALDKEMAAYPPKTLYHYLWTLSDIIDRIYMIYHPKN